MIDYELVCKNCRMPQRLHVSDRCLYTTTTFDPVRCRECNEPYEYFWIAQKHVLPPDIRLNPVHIDCHWANR